MEFLDERLESLCSDLDLIDLLKKMLAYR